MVSTLDRTTFTEELYRCYGDALVRYARTLTLGDTHAAEDLVQEAVIRAWRHAERLAATPGLTRPWLFTVIRRLVIDGHRARAARPPEHDDTGLDCPQTADPVEELLTAHVVRNALGTLPPPQRDVLVHRYLLDLSVEETAELLDIPTGTVKSRSSKALHFLRTDLSAVSAA
jgi:RNA polymerase sigma-70 factor, ECF subfamily